MPTIAPKIAYAPRSRTTTEDVLVLPYELPPTLEMMTTWARGRQQARIVGAFYSGIYQRVHRQFQKLFPTADWRVEKIAWLQWAHLSGVSPECAAWNAEECRRLDCTADEFLGYLEDVSAGLVEKPAWAKTLPPPRTIGAGFCGHFGPDRRNG